MMYCFTPLGGQDTGETDVQDEDPDHPVHPVKILATRRSDARVDLFRFATPGTSSAEMREQKSSWLTAHRPSVSVTIVRSTMAT